MHWPAALMGCLLAASACAGPQRPSVPANAVPVLFVHGHGTSSEIFADMAEHFEERGYPVDHLHAVDLVPRDGSNIVAAEQAISVAVEQLLARSGATSGKVDIIAHSMGAVSGRWYATQLRPDRVRTLVTVGGANHGTDALCGYPDAGAAELCPAFAEVGNAVQVQLNGSPDAPSDETPFGRGVDRPDVTSSPPQPGMQIRYVAVLVPGDRWIQPNSSGELDGADPVHLLPEDVAVSQPRPGNLVFGEPTDHDLILQDERFFAVLDAVLDAPVTP
jgi:pimeloyl-ACP methyl ester carboxylesterase